jgi:hypothetical protein
VTKSDEKVFTGALLAKSIGDRLVSLGIKLIAQYGLYVCNIVYCVRELTNQNNTRLEQSSALLQWNFRIKLRWIPGSISVFLRTSMLCLSRKRVVWIFRS